MNSTARATARLQNLTGQLSTSAHVTELQQAQAQAQACSGSQEWKLIKTEKKGRVGIITLNRTKALNALNDAMMAEVGEAVRQFNKDLDVGALILTGAGRAFAAGADIIEMKDKSYYFMSTFDKIAPWEELSKSKLPIIAAVNGFALGGGCEIAMMCDIILASDKAKFGQPEITIGVIPGAGGTQRLTRAIGKSRAMEMVLTGKMISAQQAADWGLAARVVPHEQLLEEAEKLATKIASLSRPVVLLAKESVNSAYEVPLAEGMHIERRLFHSCFALKDQKEGMGAFHAKRKANFTHE